MLKGGLLLWCERCLCVGVGVGVRGGCFCGIPQGSRTSNDISGVSGFLHPLPSPVQRLGCLEQ